MWFQSGEGPMGLTPKQRSFREETENVGAVLDDVDAFLAADTKHRSMVSPYDGPENDELQHDVDLPQGVTKKGVVGRLSRSIHDLFDISKGLSLPEDESHVSVSPEDAQKLRFFDGYDFDPYGQADSTSYRHHYYPTEAAFDYELEDGRVGEWAGKAKALIEFVIQQYELRYTPLNTEFNTPPNYIMDLKRLYEKVLRQLIEHVGSGRLSPGVKVFGLTPIERIDFGVNGMDPEVEKYAVELLKGIGGSDSPIRMARELRRLQDSNTGLWFADPYPAFVVTIKPDKT